MAAGKLLVVLGLALVATGVLAQTPMEQQLLAQPPSSGTYLVNGTGIVYTPDSVLFYLNNTLLGSVPLADVTGDSTADPNSHVIDLKHHHAPAPAAFDEADVLSTIISQLLDKPHEDPLDKIIIGRKLKL